jgi:hypothetical protein
MELNMEPARSRKQQLLPNRTNPDNQIWRYLDFTKYMAMLENSGLFFSRCHRLEDSFEGSRPQSNRAALRSTLISGGTSPDAVDRLLSQLSDHAKWLRQWVYVNCWHISNCESEAMWKLYAQSDRAIAIVSTYGRLRQCVGDEFWIEQLQYIDYERHNMPDGNALYPYLFKRQSFAHECELRAFNWDVPATKDGIDATAVPTNAGVWQSVDLNKLIETVRVAPKSPGWFRDLITAINKRYGLLAPVKQSDLDQDPIF